jgi:hypothetical protein
MKSMLLASNTNSALNLKFCFMKNKLIKTRGMWDAMLCQLVNSYPPVKMIIIMPVLDHEDGVHYIHNI